MSKFKELMRKADVNGAQIARRMGITTSAVSSWARGKTTPPYEKLPDLARYLGVSVDEIVRCFIDVKKDI
jgi:transcriptional regulator with XRE-family HTH domain